MSDEHDSWMQNAFGLDIGSMVQKVESAGSAVVSALGGETAPAPPPAPETAPGPAPTGDVFKADPETSKGLFDRLSDIGSDLKQKASEVYDGLESASQKVLSAESDAWNGAKGLANKVVNTYESVAPDNFTGKDWGALVDKGEQYVKDGTEINNAAWADVPVVGSLVQAGSTVAVKTSEYAGGLAKGFGDLGTTIGNNVLHPIDQAPKIAGGFLDLAEHGAPPGIAMGIKGAHGAVDLLRGKTDGKYGGTMNELADNLLHDTQRDPTDPTKTVNTDVEFLAGLGGGRKAWEDKPFEAAGRTVANIVPMLLGDEGPGVRPEESVPREIPPETPPPTVRDPVPPQFDPEHVHEPFDPSPSAKPTVRDPVPPQFDPEHVHEPFDPSPSAKPDTQRTPTQHFENGVVDTDVEPKTPVEEPSPHTVRDPSNTSTPEVAQAERRIAEAEQAVRDAQNRATAPLQEFAQYKRGAPPLPDGMPEPSPPYDPAVAERLENEASGAMDEVNKAYRELQDARRARRDALGRAAAKKGGSLFGPPKR